MRARPRQPPKFQKGNKIGKWSLLFTSTIVHFLCINGDCILPFAVQTAGNRFLSK
jgi:hypothetical protein